MFSGTLRNLFVFRKKMKETTKEFKKNFSKNFNLKEILRKKKEI